MRVLFCDLIFLNLLLSDGLAFNLTCKSGAKGKLVL